jgi:hypothetical protein
MLNKTKMGLLAGLAVACLVSAPSVFALDLPQQSELAFDFVDRSGLFAPDGTPRAVGFPATVGDEDRAIFYVNSIGPQVNPAPNIPPIIGGILPGLNLGTTAGTNMLTGTFYDLQLAQLEIFAGADGVFGTTDDKILTGFVRGVRQTNTTVNPGDAAGQGGASWTDIYGATAPAGSGGITAVFLDTVTESGSSFQAGSAGPAGSLPTLTANPGNLDGSLSHIQEYDNGAAGKNLTDGELWLASVFTPLLQADIDGYFSFLGTAHSITEIDSVTDLGGSITPNGTLLFSLGTGKEVVYLQQIDNASRTGDFFAYANVIGGSFADQMVEGLYGGPNNERDVMFWGQNTVNPLLFADTPTNQIISQFGYQGWQLDSTDPVAFGTKGPEGIIPEPVTAGLSLLALGALGLGATRRRRNA